MTTYSHLFEHDLIFKATKVFMFKSLVPTSGIYPYEATQKKEKESASE